MFSMSRFLWIVFALLVVGCATHGSNNGDSFEQLIKTGQCDQADLIAAQKQSGSELYLLKALVAGDCRKDRSKAVQYLTISAKMGNADARSLLQKLGKPVPKVQEASIGPVTVETPYVQTAPVNSGNGAYSRCTRGPQGTLTCYREDGSSTKCRAVGIQVQCREM